MANLMLHCGGRLVDRDQLQQVELPPRTETWVPIAHDRLLDQVEDTLTRTELKIENQALALSPDGARFFGLMELDGQSEEDHSMVLGVRNSIDKSCPASLVLGSVVLVCDNMAFSGEITLARRHTVNIERDLPQLVERAVGMLGSLRNAQSERIDAYKHHRLAEARAHDLFVQAIDCRVLPVTTLPRSLKEFREPSHPEFLSNGQRTAWTFFNSVTEVLKGRNLDQLPRRTQALHGLLDSIVAA